MVEVSVVPYKHKYHAALLELLDIEAKSLKKLPKIGYIAFLGKKPIACGFIRKLEPCYGILDMVKSVSYYGSVVRLTAEALIHKSLISDAKANKIEIVDV